MFGRDERTIAEVDGMEPKNRAFQARRSQSRRRRRRQFSLKSYSRKKEVEIAEKVTLNEMKSLKKPA
jgi:hypothetical protein